jgi:predicted phage terminase large subunit-like protein
MLSRNRSTCGVRPYVRATCNPDADSWAASFIAWWIDRQTGLAIPERSGLVRWMLRHNDVLHWADSAAELAAEFGEECGPKSVTFIASSIHDNRILLRADPGYLANLKALPLVERERLLGGNWKIRPAAGLFFQRSWVRVIDEAPACLRLLRYWDLAATEKTDSNDPDFTVCVKMGTDDAGRYFVLHGLSLRKSPHHVAEAVANMASQDGRGVAVGLPRDPGQAGKSQAQTFVKMLAGHTVHTRPESGDKPTRFGPFSAQCEAGNVFFVRGDWNEEFFDQLEGFPDAAHDDHADACSGAFNYLAERRAPMRVNPGIIRR